MTELGEPSTSGLEVDLSAVWETIVERYPYLAAAAPMKNEFQYEEYGRLLRLCGSITHLLELGIYRGGSVILWHEAFHARVSALDIDLPPDSLPLLERYLDEAGANRQVFLHFRTGQSNDSALRRVVAEDLGGVLDAVIDDASHLYQPTKDSFAVLFELLRPGGAYFIEDWSAGGRPDFGWADRPLDELIKELVGHHRDGSLPIKSIHLESGLALVLKSSPLAEPPSSSDPTAATTRPHAGAAAGPNRLANFLFREGATALGAASGWTTQERPCASYRIEAIGVDQRAAQRLEVRGSADPIYEFAALRQHVPQLDALADYEVTVEYMFRLESAPDPSRLVGAVVYCLNDRAQVAGTFVNWGWPATEAWSVRMLRFTAPTGTRSAFVEFRLSANGVLWVSRPSLIGAPDR